MQLAGSPSGTQGTRLQLGDESAILAPAIAVTETCNRCGAVFRKNRVSSQTLSHAPDTSQSFNARHRPALGIFQIWDLINDLETPDQNDWSTRLPRIFCSRTARLVKTSQGSRHQWTGRRTTELKGKPASRFTSEPSWFYFPRFGKDDRKHGIPNPVSYLLLAQAIADNYVAIRKVAKSSKISASPPIFDWNGHRALMLT